MPAPRIPVSGLDYRRWQERREVIGGRTFAVATKPGLPGHGSEDPGTLMLANAMRDVHDRVVVVMPSGNGLVGAAAAAFGARHVYMSDRHSLAVRAARMTCIANEVDTATVVDGQGIAPLPEGIVADVVAIRVVPEAFTMRHLLHDALAVLRPGGTCLVAGANDEGARSAARALEAMFGNVRVLAQRRGHRLVGAVRPEVPPAMPAWLETPYVDTTVFHHVPVSLSGREFDLHTRPGVFSWQHLDDASALLLQHLTIPSVSAGARVLDLGCGAGVLGIGVALQSPTLYVDLVDVDTDAVRCATATIQSLGLANATAMVSDIAESVLEQLYDMVVSNPPFHSGKLTDLGIPRQFIRDAFHVLRPGGRLVLVANRTLPYEQDIADLFGAVSVLHDGRQFKVLGATKS